MKILEIISLIFKQVDRVWFIHAECEEFDDGEGEDDGGDDGEEKDT